MPNGQEKKLIAQALRGHADAYRAIVDAYKDRLYAFVLRVVRNHHEAEDVCQAAFVKAFASLASYSSQYAFSTWLFTIAYRVALNHLRKQRECSGQTDFSLVGGASQGAADEVAGSEAARRLRDEVWSAVDQLSPAQKTAVLLFYRENQSCQEIGLVLGIPAVTVKSHLHRAREKLRSLLRSDLADEWMGNTERAALRLA